MSEEDYDDSDSFRAAMADVRPLRHDKVELRAPAPAPIPKQRLADERQVIEDLLSDLFEPAELDTGDELYFLKAGMQHRVLRKLRRGQYSVQAELDLHGLTVPLAREAIGEFLFRCRQQQTRCVRIIHGKGRRSSNKGPVLKVKLDHWLRQRDEVLAFCTARPMDGGTGAVYVLLKRM